MNTIGTHFRLTTFGESHGAAIGGVIDGCPAGVALRLDEVQEALDRRRPGGSDLTTPRKEEDRIEFLSGLMDGITTGAPIAFLIRNSDQRSGDYSSLEQVYRPSHADYTYTAKYGVRDHRGGGRSSARETAVRVAAGAIAMQILNDMGIEIVAYTASVGKVSMPQIYLDFVMKEEVEAHAVRTPLSQTAREMEEEIKAAREEGDSVGGTIACIIRGVPPGWGAPLYDKLSAKLSSAMLSINACKAFELGDGFAGCHARGSEQNDSFVPCPHSPRGIATLSNHSGGIQGGISNGEVIRFRVGFKPVSSISKKQQSVNKVGEQVEIEIAGRHDPCVLPRAVPIVEAMAALVLADSYLASLGDRREG